VPDHEGKKVSEFRLPDLVTDDRTLELQNYASEQEAKLLPCPFCGSKAYYVRSVNGSNMHRCGCHACGVYFKSPEVYHPGGDYLTKDIVSAWNQRADPCPKGHDE